MIDFRQFKTVAHEITRAFVAPDVPGLKESKMAALPLRNRTLVNVDAVRIRLYLGEERPDEKQAVEIVGFLKPGRTPGLTEMTYHKEKVWTVPSAEIMYRLTHALHQTGFSYLATSALEAGKPFFEAAGFHIAYASSHFVHSKIDSMGITAAIQDHITPVQGGVPFGYVDFTDAVHLTNVKARLAGMSEAKSAATLG